VIVANRDRLEPPLVNCSLSLEPTMYLPSSGVGGREPVHEARERSIDVRREQKMPVVWHHTVREKRDAVSVDRRTEHTLERGVIFSGFKESRTFRSSVDDVKEQTGGRNARPSRHDRESHATRVPFAACFVSVLIK